MIVYSTDPQGLEGRKQVKLLINSLKHERKKSNRPRMCRSSGGTQDGTESIEKIHRQPTDIRNRSNHSVSKKNSNRNK
ncbi:MAG: hypothetical protein WC942_03840 [Clostridia bacterium]